MIICNYTSENYEKCLNVSLPTWKKVINVEKILVYSDTDKFGIKLFQKSQDFNESCRRKILIIKKTLEDNIGKDVLYLDTDCLLLGDTTIVFSRGYDLTVTRMVRRDRFKREINAGVSFWKANSESIQFCNDWLKKESDKKYTIFPEQKAFNDLVYLAYDGLYNLDVGNVSENIFNYERDNEKEFLKYFKKYNPVIVHLKQGLWKQKNIMNLFKIID